MRKAFLSAAAGLLILLSHAAAQAKDRVILKPVKPWDLDYGLTQCVAMRQYGDPSNPVSFAIVPAPNGDSFELLVARRRVGSDTANELEGSVDFGNGPIKAWLLEYLSSDGRLLVDQFRIGSAEMAQARAASSVTFHMQGGPDASFELDHVPALMDGLADCTADLETYWNMDGEKDGRIATPARGALRKIFDSYDYPAQAMRNHQQGDNQYLLLVDEKGKVAGCHVMLASGVPLLDAMGCAVIRDRARFKPALNGAGQPVRSTVVTPQVRWRIRA